MWVDPAAWRIWTAPARIPPSFLIIGAQRSGSTSLFRYLAMHPCILAALRKEVHYFDFQCEKGPGWYLAHFPGAHRRLLAGSRPTITFEASPYYMVHPMAPQRIKAFNPDMKLIAILRDPVDRALSHYHHECRLGVETLAFEEAIAAEPERLSDSERLLKQPPHYFCYRHRHFSYLDRGRYAHHLEAWLDHFPRRNLFVLRSEDLFEDADTATNKVFAFLGLPAHRIAADAPPGSAYRPMDPDLRERLHEYFAPDQERLDAMLGSPANASSRPSSSTRTGLVSGPSTACSPGGCLSNGSPSSSAFPATNEIGTRTRRTPTPRSHER